MRSSLLCAAVALALTGCGPADAPQAGAPDAPQLDTPAPEREPARAFAAVNDSARAVTGELSVIVALRLPDADQAGAAPQDVLTLRGANGLAIDAEITGAVSPATQLEGQTLRALLALPVDEPQVLVYRVASETKAGGQGLCGAGDAAFVVLWEPAGPGETALKVMGVAGGAPGAAGARACAMLEYGRRD